MARPLPAPAQLRNGSNGHVPGRPTSAAAILLHPAPVPAESASAPESDEAQELGILREENAAGCGRCAWNWSSALHEASLPGHAGGGDRLKEYEAMVEEKTEMIRQQHEQLQELQAVIAELECKPARGRRTPARRRPRTTSWLSVRNWNVIVGKSRKTSRPSCSKCARWK